LEVDAILMSPQGFGPARNIAAFTGGDVVCCPDFYGECARLIKEYTDLWVLIETNGYGLTPRNLDTLRASGVDAFWLDIKAHDAERHKWLTGSTNMHILKLPERILKLGFTLEVLSLFIPNLVDADELEMIASDLSAVDPSIPFTILAFFPEYRMKNSRAPTTEEMVEAYARVRSTGLNRVRLGNLGVFVRSERDQKLLIDHVDKGAYSLAPADVYPRSGLQMG
jgi:pyruvate-formate lyase-activating enzyme